MNKVCNIVMLSTNEEAVNSFILKGVVPNLIRLTSAVKDDISDWMKFGKPQHLYITSDDEVKEGDWCIVKDLFDPFRYGIDYVPMCTCRKIIASTDPLLNLPTPSKQFIQKYIAEYNKGNVIKQVLVEYTSIQKLISSHDSRTGKEIKWVDVPKTDSHNNIIIHPIKNSWSREELPNLKDISDRMKRCRKILQESKLMKGNWGILDTTDLDKWIEENL